MDKVIQEKEKQKEGRTCRQKNKQQEDIAYSHSISYVAFGKNVSFCSPVSLSL